jgi:hypothetical protein
MRWVVACAAAVLLAACDDGPSAQAPANDAPSTAAPKSPANPLPPGMVAAVSSTQNSRVVGLHFQLKDSPTVGKALPVDIAIVPHAVLSSLKVSFAARDGIAVAAGGTGEQIKAPVPEKVIDHKLVLLPNQEGVFTVTALVETEGSEGMISRIFSIPVIVSAAAAATPAEPPAPAAPPPAPPAGG